MIDGILILPLCDGTGVPRERDLDAELMHEAGTGCQQAFSALVQRYHEALLRFFGRMGARSDSEDLVQDTFVRLFRYRDRYRPTAKFSTFLYTLARHAWADQSRKAMRWERFATKLELEAEVLTEAGGGEMGRDFDVEAALSKLSHKLREVVDLYFYQGLRQQDIAQRLGVPLGTVKSRINLAVNAMREVGKN